jgi:nucleotide-binding universal stress UspA family protein
MHKLLVPFDGSENAHRALRFAIDEARRNVSGSVHLVHAHDEPRMYGEIAVYISPERMAEMQREESKMVLANADPILEKAGVSHTKEALIGPVGAVIAKRADDLGCDGIVMGSRGMGAVGNLVLGSVATKVIHHANVPVTLVK